MACFCESSGTHVRSRNKYIRQPANGWKARAIFYIQMGWKKGNRSEDWDLNIFLTEMVEYHNT